VTQGFFAGKDYMVETFGFYFPDKIFSEGIQIGRKRRKADWFYPGAFHDCVELRGIFCVAVMDEIAYMFKRSIPAG
jgi:hypothetical protein